MKKVKLNWVLIHHSKLWKQNLNNLKKVLGDKECKTEEMFEIIEVENGNIKRNFDTWKIDHNVIICILMTLLGTETNLGAIQQGIWKVLFIYEIFMQDGRFNTYIYIFTKHTNYCFPNESCRKGKKQVNKFQISNLNSKFQAEAIARFRQKPE